MITHKHILHLMNIPTYSLRQTIPDAIKNIPALSSTEPATKEVFIKATIPPIIPQSSQPSLEAFSCGFALKLLGNIFIIADFSMTNEKNKRAELSLLSSLLAKLQVPVDLEREFTFPLPILPDKSKESAKTQLEKLIFWLRHDYKIEHFLVLSKDRDFFSFLAQLSSAENSTIFSHTLAEMIDTPTLRKELWEQIHTLRDFVSN